MNAEGAGCRVALLKRRQASKLYVKVRPWKCILDQLNCLHKRVVVRKPFLWENCTCHAPNQGCMARVLQRAGDDKHGGPR